MADGRLKAVVDDNSVKEEGVGIAGEHGGLELRLSLGRCEWSGGSSSSSSSRSRRTSGPLYCDLNVGSSGYSEKLVSGSRCWHNTGEEFRGEMEGLGLDECGSHSTERGPIDDRDVDAQNKRAKVLFEEEAHLQVPSFVTEAAALPAIENDTDSQTLFTYEDMMIDYFTPNINADNSRNPINISGCESDSRKIDTSNADNLENRMDLTEDLLHLVFSFLDQRDLCKAGATCKQWRVPSMHKDFWKSFNLEGAAVSQENVEALCRRYPNANEVNLFGVLNTEILVMEAMTSLRYLETLYLGKGLLGDGFFQALPDCPSLNSLSINDATLGIGNQEISIHHDRLRQLNLVKCRVLRVSVRCPQLQTLALRRSSMSHALLSCPKLYELDLSSCHKLSDVGIRSAAASCPLLASLNLASCSYVSDDTLREIAFACPNIRVLDASYCPNITLESVRLPMLIDLKLHNCDGITSASVSAISYSRMLEALQLDNCNLLKSVSLNLPHLERISLVHCRKFLDLNLLSPRLTYVKVSNCSLLRYISIMSNELKKLVLQKQEGLANLLLQCNNLQEVDLSDCESLTSSVCEIFSDRGGCPKLKSLILDNCESLTTVRLNTCSLASLSLVGCRAVHVLDLLCPNLLKINLDGCDHLEEASFTPVGLQNLNLGICPKLSVLKIEAPKMSVLELKGCGRLSQASICCPNLTSLDASFCRQITNASLSRTVASCPQIESLILSSCLSIDFDGLSSLISLQSLTQLDLSYTFLMNLQPVFDSCCQLVILKLSACKYLSDSSLDSLYTRGALPHLRELDLSYSSISQAAIVDLLAYCANLISVNLNGCVYMHELVWDSRGLQPTETSIGTSSNFLPLISTDGMSCTKTDHLLEVLNCTGCPYLKKVVIPLTAPCFYLVKLNLNLSANLKEVDLACPNLNTLNLSNCTSLEILKLDCPRLSNLQLSGCNMLSEAAVEAAISGCCIWENPIMYSCTKAKLLQRITGN